MKLQGMSEFPLHLCRKNMIKTDLPPGIRKGPKSLKAQEAKKRKSQPLYSILYLLFLFDICRETGCLVEPLHLKVFSRRVAGMQLWWTIEAY